MRLHYTILITFTILLANSQFKAKLYHVQPYEHSMLGHCEKTDGKIYNHSIMTGVIASQLKVSKGRPVSKCIFIILLANAFDIEKTHDQEVQNGHAALAIKQWHGNKKLSVVIPVKHSFIFNTNTYNQIYSDSWMQAIYHGNACNVECQIVMPHCLIPPIPLKLKISLS